MSDLSSNDTLEPLTSPTAQEANIVDNIPEDWESVIDFEMKENEKLSNLETTTLPDSNRPDSAQSPNKQGNLEKEEGTPMEMESETSPKEKSTEAAHDESSNAMELEKSTINEMDDKTMNPNGATPESQESASTVNPHTTTSDPKPMVKQMAHVFHRLLQKGVMSNDRQLNIPRSMIEASKSLEEILMNFAEEDKATIGVFNNLIYLPPHLFEKYLAPTAKAIKKINELANTLFSETDATMVKALFTEASMASVIDTPADVTEQPVKDTLAAITELKEIVKSKETTIEKYVEQLRKAAELPNEETIIAMADEELLRRNQRLDRLFTSFEAQIKRDYLSLQKIKSENILLANMNYTQLKNIYKLTDDYTQVQLEKAELSQKLDGLDITSKVADIQKNLDGLKATLENKLTGLSQIIRPNVDQPLKETNTRLKEALRVAIKTNAQVTKKYDELSLHYSFMPQTFREMVDQMKDEKDPVYLNQRHDPNNLRPASPIQDLNFELGPVNINEGDLNKYLQRTAPLAYNDLLDTQLETNSAELRPLTNAIANANDHSYSPLAQSLRSEQDQNSSSTIETQTITGKRSGQDPIPPNAKQARRERPTVATEIPDASPSAQGAMPKPQLPAQQNYPLISHKHTPVARGNRDTRPFPYFVYNQEVIIYTMRTLHWDARCPYKINAPRLLSDNASNAPTEEFLLERVHPAQALEGKTKLLYRSALANFNKVHKSTGQYCYETVNKAKVYTSIYTNVEGEEAVNTTNYRQIYKALDWQLVDKLGDYYKILRARPIPRNRETKPITFEYLPNNVYSYEETRSMLWQHSSIVVKANRYWDDRFVRDLPKAVFYSLHDFCPGMPVNLKAECEAIGLHPFRPAEMQPLDGTNGTGSNVYDTEKTVNTMVNDNTLMDNDIHTVEMYVEGCLNPLIDKYWELDRNWPFELPRLLIRAHAVRLKDLRTVLQEYTKGNKQAIVKPNGYENSASSSARSRPQNTEQVRQGHVGNGLGGSSR